MITVAEIDRKTIDIDNAVSALRAEADALAFAAVSGDAPAKARLEAIRSEMVAAAFDRETLAAARGEAERLEAEEKARIAKEARRAALGEARELAGELVEKARGIDGLIGELGSAISALEGVQINVNRAFHRAGQPFSRSFTESAPLEARKRVENMFSNFADLRPLEELLEDAWGPLLHGDDEELDEAVIARQNRRRDRTPEELAAEIAAIDDADRLARIRYEQEPINLVFGAGPG